MKKLFTFFAFLFGFGFAALAEGNDPAIDVSAASSALTDMKTALTTYWTAAQPILVWVLGIALVVGLIFLGYKLFKKGTNKVG